MEIRCLCNCHRETRLVPFVGVSVENDIEAVTACTGCVNNHCAALLHTRLLTDPEPRCAEMAVWVDPPVSQSDGSEGPE